MGLISRQMLLLLTNFGFKGILHPYLKISTFRALSQNYQHLFEKQYMYLTVNCPRNSKMAFEFK